MKCEYCGTVIPDGAEECPACGAGIKILTESPAAGENTPAKEGLRCRLAITGRMIDWCVLFFCSLLLAKTLGLPQEIFAVTMFGLFFIVTIKKM